ncbi:MAG: hypothetical protein MO846_08120 [Candidatus Devosia symbiotica]|nr:hypothetical protein [Candidatus Devosia symbiotica]
MEIEEQLAIVRAQRASEIQGCLFSPPLSPTALLNLLRAQGKKAMVAPKPAHRGQAMIGTVLSLAQ